MNFIFNGNQSFFGNKTVLRTSFLAFVLLPMLVLASSAGAMQSGKSPVSPQPLSGPRAKSAAVIANGPSGKSQTSAAAKSKSAPRALPVIDGEEAMATVAGDPITVRQFDMVLAQLHSSLSNKEKGKTVTAKRINYAGVLDRLINVSLADHEARVIGFDQLPEVKRQVKAYSKIALASMVTPGPMTGVKPDPAFERHVYMELVKEYKLQSAVFEIKEFAQQIQSKLSLEKSLNEQKNAIDLLNSWARSVRPGEDFDKVVKEATKKGMAVANLKGYYVKPEKMPPYVVAVLNKMKVGQTSPMLAAGVNRYVLLKLVGIRYPKGDKKAMAQARQIALNAAIANGKNEFLSGLVKKYIVPHWSVIQEMGKINYTSKGFDIHKYFKDKRVLAVVKGGEPVTVGDLAKAIDKHFYHGLNSTTNQEVIKVINVLLSSIFQKRALMQQAISEGLQNSSAYKDSVRDYENTLLFGLFMQKVVEPGVKVRLADVTGYYKKHKSDYSTDERMRIRVLAFKKKQNAQNAVSMLKSGDEFHWVKDNAQGQAPNGEKSLVDFGNSAIDVKDLPPDARAVLKGAKTGDVRFYEGAVKTAKEGKMKKRFYALYIEKEFPPVPKPFDQVKAGILKKLFEKQYMKEANKWFAKLRKAYAVKIYDTSL